jgi:hypothetical protein
MFHLFAHLILSANHEPGKWKGIDMLPGQLITGRESLSRDTGIAIQTIRTCIARLKSTGEITIKSTNQFSLITITNWPIYQGLSTSDSTDELTSDQPAINQRSTTNKNIKNIKKEKNEKNIYGQKFHRVKLTEAERQSLSDTYGDGKAQEMIDNMDLYLESKGDKYKSHYATLLSWERKNGGNSDGQGRSGQRATEGKTSSARNLGDGQAYPCDLEVTE